MMHKIAIPTFLLVLLLVGMNGCVHKFEEPIDISETATPYTIEIPPFFPPMDIPADNPMTIEGIKLGRFLFWEKMLSADNSISCGSCHLPSASFSDPAQFSTGVTGEQGNRQSMALVNLGWARDYFWDGRAPTIEEQIHEPLPNPIEMNQPWVDALEKLRATDLYPPLFEEAFGTPEITELRTRKSIAQFLRTLISADSNFDKWRRGQYTLTESEFRGYELFLKEGGDPETVEGGEFGADCFHCHVEAGMQFSDYLPHNNGLDSVFDDLGFGGITGNPLENGKFKTPSLRNIEFTAPYMHDGRFSSLEEVIDHYDSGGLPSETVDPFMKYQDGGLMLSDQSKEDLINFLLTLSDDSFLTNPAFQDPHE